MTTPHKWAAEIHAMADGKEVEGCPNDILAAQGVWESAYEHFNPLTNPHYKWRIKPEKQVLRYRVALMRSDSGARWLSFAEEGDDYLENNDGFVEWLHDWQEVEVE